ncbi:protein PFC0760c-like [Mytilus californianus]|uniref:protein PFC0760c-like n=1 Tax=Mytilus californianus TaxID=6549 RepID=UPI0022460CB4|nr:protein PFC0760c-like [Mytilus californianus]
MMRWCVQCGIFFYVCILITCLLPILCFTLENISLPEPVLTKSLQTRLYNTGIQKSKTSSPGVFFNKIEFTFHEPRTEFQLNNFHHGRFRRETSGVLSADDIQASHVKTNSLTAKLVKADKVRARNVKASIITVGKKSALQKFDSSRMSGNFVSKQYVKIPEEVTAVTSGRNFRNRANLYRFKSRNPKKKKYSFRWKKFKRKPSPFTRNYFIPSDQHRLIKSFTIVKKNERLKNVDSKNRMSKSNDLFKNKKSTMHQGFVRSRKNTEPHISDKTQNESQISNRTRSEPQISDTKRSEPKISNTTRTESKEMSLVQKRNILLENWKSNLSVFKRKQVIQNLEMNRKNGYVRKSSATYKYTRGKHTPVQNTNMLQNKLLMANTKDVTVRHVQSQEASSNDFYTYSEEYDSEKISKGDDDSDPLLKRRLKTKLPSRSTDSVRAIQVHDNNGWKKKESFYSNSDSYESLDYEDDMQVPLKADEPLKPYESFFDSDENESVNGIEEDDSEKISRGDDDSDPLLKRRLKTKLPSRSKDSVRAIQVNDNNGWKKKESIYSNSDSYESLDYEDDMQVPLKADELLKPYESFFDSDENERVNGIEEDDSEKISRGDDDSDPLLKRRLKTKLPSRSKDSVRAIQVHDNNGWKKKESFYSNSDSYDSLDYGDDMQVPLKADESLKPYESFFDSDESESVNGIEAFNIEQKAVQKRVYNAYDKNYVSPNNRADNQEREYTSSDNTLFSESEPFLSSSDHDWSVYDSSSYEENKSQQPLHTEKSNDKIIKITSDSAENVPKTSLHTDKSDDKVIKDYYYIDSNENSIESDYNNNNEEEYFPRIFQNMKIVHTDNDLINSQEHDYNDFYTESKENDSDETSKGDDDSDGLLKTSKTIKTNHTSAESSEFLNESFENWFSNSENI